MPPGAPGLPGARAGKDSDAADVPKVSEGSRRGAGPVLRCPLRPGFSTTGRTRALMLRMNRTCEGECLSEAACLALHTLTLSRGACTGASCGGLRPLPVPSFGAKLRCPCGRCVPGTCCVPAPPLSRTTTVMRRPCPSLRRAVCKVGFSHSCAFLAQLQNINIRYR